MMETITDALVMAVVIGVVIFLCRLIVKKKDSARTLPKFAVSMRDCSRFLTTVKLGV